MKKLLCQFLLTIILFMCFINSYADEISCPPPDRVKAVKFIKAIKNPYDEDSWAFYSNAFYLGKNNWNVWFGTFLPHAKTVEEALEQGQEYFDRHSLPDEIPTAYHIPNHVILCMYVPTDMPYWVEAYSPPQYQDTPRLRSWFKR